MLTHMLVMIITITIIIIVLYETSFVLLIIKVIHVHGQKIIRHKQHETGKVVSLR